jgi:hypothetical protein
MGVHGRRERGCDTPIRGGAVGDEGIENWEIGKLGNWEIGKLGNWEIGKLGNWEIGAGGDDNWSIDDQAKAVSFINCLIA